MNLHELLSATAARHPDRIAVVGPEGPVRYGELDRTADGLASRLIELGAGPGDRILVWDDKSPMAVAAMQAAMRIGGAYVPADGAAPPSRIQVIARDCAARVVCAPRPLIERVEPDLPAAVCHLDLTAAPVSVTTPVAAPVAPDDPAYILYTSGSTGAPKGVCISHRNARAFVDWAVRKLEVGPEDRLANHAPLTFDLSVFDLYAAFATGASVHLIPPTLAYAPTQLTEFLYQHKITIWYSVPSALILMIRDGDLLRRQAPPELRAVLFAGEPLPVNHVRDLWRWTRARLFNLYGPTETNVCTCHEALPADLLRDRPVPIGAAVGGNAVWAEKANGAVAGPGEEGELVVAGPTVMLGYWGHEWHSGPYRTGDIVRVLDGAAFDYVGRSDHMVKLRGHRVEPGEVEAALTAHPDVAEAVVTVRGTGLNARLEAYVVPWPASRLSVLALKRHCAERLPRYMIAEEFHLVPRLPRTRTGKTDRARLAELHPDEVLVREQRSS